MKTPKALPLRMTLVLNGDQADSLRKIQSFYTNQSGLQFTLQDACRMAILALAKKEGVTA